VRANGGNCTLADAFVEVRRATLRRMQLSGTARIISDVPDPVEPAIRFSMRRRFLKRAALAVGAMGVGAVGYSWLLEPHWIEVVRRRLPIANLPAALVGKTLVQISDLHVGPVVDEDYITGAMRKVSSLGADVVTITGDFMTADGGEQVPAVVRVLKHLQPGKLATVGVLGNHDYALRWANPVVADQLTRKLTDLGITMLRNAVLDVQGLQIAGIDEFWGPSFNPASALQHLDPKGAALMLCHNPDAMDVPVWSGYQGWILAGHTHGGQCKPPFFSPPVIPVRNKRYTAGEFDLFDGRRLYINRGLGYLRRVRFNARPEITVFTMQKG
jgi:predicted MPP superfamily phosphohydrolase